MKIMERTPVKRTHITHFAQEFGQCEAAALLKMTQGALSKAIRRGRNVYVTKLADGSYTAEEVRTFPSQNSAKNNPLEAVAV